MTELTFEEYLKYFDIGTRDYVIAAVTNTHRHVLKALKKKWGFGIAEQRERKLSVYLKWKEKGYLDNDIAKLMGCTPKHLNDFKRNGNLTKAGYNYCVVKQRPARIRTLY